jgi:hypothetical protein
MAVLKTKCFGSSMRISYMHIVLATAFRSSVGDIAQHTKLPD